MRIVFALVSHSKRTPQEQLAVSDGLAALPGRRSFAFFQAHGLGAPYSAPGSGASKESKVVAALSAAEKAGRLDETIEAAAQFLKINLTPRASTQEDGLPVSTQKPEHSTARAIFISHASHDRMVADLLTDSLVLGGIPREQIFYSSQRSTGIKAGQDVLASLRSALDEAALVIELLSATYLTRPVCMMEFGAAWAANKPTFPILLPSLSRNEAISNVGNVFMHELTNDQDAVSDIFDELHEPAIEATRSQTRMTAWRRGSRHFAKQFVAQLDQSRPTEQRDETAKTSTPRSASAQATSPTAGGQSSSRPKLRKPATSPAMRKSTGVSALESSTDRARAALNALRPVTRKVVLHYVTWGDGIKLDRSESVDPENAREIEFDEVVHDAWVPRAQHRKVEAAIGAASAWRQAMEEPDESDADTYLDKHDLDELDPMSHDVWRKLRFIS